MCARHLLCARADEIFGVDGLHVLEVTFRDAGVVLDVESAQTVTGCPDCGVVAVGHGCGVQVLHDAPCFARAVRVRWFKRIWRCREPACPRAMWTEDHFLRGATGEAHGASGGVGGPWRRRAIRGPTTAGSLTSPAGAVAGFSRAFVAAAIVAVLLTVVPFVKMPSTHVTGGGGNLHMH